MFPPSLVLEKQGRLDEAQALLKGLIRRYPDTKWAGRASLRMGMLLSESEDSIAPFLSPSPLAGEGRVGALIALDYFNEAIRLLDIDSHVMFHLADAQRNMKLYSEAIRTYGAVELESTGRPLSAAALFKKAETLEEAGMTVEARNGFMDFVLAHPRHKFLPDALLKAASLSVLLDDKDSAFRYSRRLLLEYPAHKAAASASEIQNSLISSGLPALSWSIDERVLRARGFFSVARYDMAAEELSLVISEAEGERYAESAALYSASLMRLKRYKEATASLKEQLRRGAGAKEREAPACCADCAKAG